MTMYRQVQLRRMLGENAETTLDLNTAPYKVAAGSWRSEGARLEVGIVIEATTLTALDRAVAAIWRMLSQAAAYSDRTNGLPIYVFTKTGDTVDATAEIGATWLRKLVTVGSLSVPDPSLMADGHFTVTATLTLSVPETWERAWPAQVLVGYDSATTIAQSDGSIKLIGQPLTARRVRWTSSTGLTVRFFWDFVNPGGSLQVNFVRLSANFRCYYGASTGKFTIGEESGKTTQTGAYTFAFGDIIEVVVRWSSAAMAVFVNGVKAVESVTAISWPTDPETYSLLSPDATVTAKAQSIQTWPSALTDDEIEGMYGWGVPEPELCFSLAPASTALTSLYRYIYNVPGDALAPMRVVMAGSASFDQVRAHLRLLAAPATVVKECESGTLGTDVATNANAAASGGSQARFTPSNTSWAVRVTHVIAGNPEDVQDYLGRHRLFLAAYDSAAATNINQIRWQVEIAGVSEAYSEEVSLAAVATRSLVDLGILEIPPGAWPDETATADSDVVGGNYVRLKIEARNTTGSGGGTLDLDALYLAPAEIETEVTCAEFDQSDEFVVVDYLSLLPNAVTVRNWRTMEWATWGQATGDRLELTPRTGLAGFLWMYGYRDSSEQVLPNDTASLYLFYRPHWVR